MRLCLSFVLSLAALTLWLPAMAGRAEQPFQEAEVRCSLQCQDRYNVCVSREAAGAGGIGDDDMIDIGMDHCEDERLGCVAACPPKLPAGGAGVPGTGLPQ